MNDPRHSLEYDLYFRSYLDTFVEGVKKSKSPQCFCLYDSLWIHQYLSILLVPYKSRESN